MPETLSLKGPLVSEEGMEPPKHKTIEFVHFKWANWQACESSLNKALGKNRELAIIKT